MDVNLLPDELKKREEEERRRQAARPIEVPMSTPVKESEKPDAMQTTVPVAGLSGKPADITTPKLPHLKEHAYISVDTSGKLSRSTSPPLTSGARSPLSWWRRLLQSLRGGRVRRILAPQERPPAPQPAPVPPSPRPLAVTIREEAKHPAPPLVRGPSVVIEKSISIPPPPPLLPPTPPPAPQPAPSPAPPRPPAPPAAKAPPPSPPKTDTAAGAPYDLGPPPLGINLIPTEWSLVSSLAAPLRRRILLILLVFFGLSVVGSLGGRALYAARLRQRLDQITVEHQALQDKLATYSATEVEWTKLKSRLEVLSLLLKRHVSVAPVFRVLEQTVLPAVHYTSLTLDGSGAVNVEGVTTRYADVAEQVVALRQVADVHSVAIQSTALNPAANTVTFTLAIRLAPEVLRYVTP